MIDRKTGAITMSAAIQIRLGDSFDCIAAFRMGEMQEVSDKQTGWKWLTVKNVVVETNYFLVSFGFYNDILLQISLVISSERFRLNLGWEAWSEADERHTLNLLRQWVLAELGREGGFDWGTVYTNHDPKGGTSAIHITYTA